MRSRALQNLGFKPAVAAQRGGARSAELGEGRVNDLCAWLKRAAG